MGLYEDTEASCVHATMMFMFPFRVARSVNKLFLKRLSSHDLPIKPDYLNFQIKFVLSNSHFSKAFLLFGLPSA